MQPFGGFSRIMTCVTRLQVVLFCIASLLKNIESKVLQHFFGKFNLHISWLQKKGTQVSKNAL